MTSLSAGLITIFLGAPGAGKGTQAAAAAQALGLTHISSGDMFRRAVESQGELGNIVRAYMEKGSLVPDEITIRMVLNELGSDRQSIILDGFPRNLTQATSLDKALGQEDRGVDRVIYINVSNDELLRRLSSRWLCRQCQAPYTRTGDGGPAFCSKCTGELYQRPDDQPETIKKRLAVYFTETAPLVAHYRGQGKLCEIDGEGGVEAITKRVIKALEGGGKVEHRR